MVELSCSVEKKNDYPHECYILIFFLPLSSTVVFLCNISPKLSITDQVTTLLRHISYTSHVIQQAKKKNLLSMCSRVGGLGLR